MPYYKDTNLLFIHIPKTGGSVIENQINLKYKQTLYSGFTNDLLSIPYRNISLQHQTYRTLYKHRNKLDIDFSNMRIFCVVRNPYDRLISDLFWYDLIKPEYTSDQVHDVIINNYLNRKDLDNHVIPQYKFISNGNFKIPSNIKIFKCETLNADNNKINKFLGFDINIKKNNVNKDYSKYLNSKTIALINILYAKDFELFHYKKKYTLPNKYYSFDKYIKAVSREYKLERLGTMLRTKSEKRRDKQKKRKQEKKTEKLERNKK